MLRVAKVRRGGHAYYLEVAAGGQGAGIEASGVWVGRGAGAFGLDGVVRSQPLAALMAGDDPVSGRRLGPWHDRVTVAAFDLSFCAPKSVSLLHALGPPEVRREVGAAHGGAVVAALDYVERCAVAVRRHQGDVAVPARADAVPAAAFVHRVSRALDPHLHTHVVVANLGRDEQGSFSALDGRGVYAHTPAADALYHAHLRYELTARLGVAWGPMRSGRADVAGIGVEARTAFSRRAAAIAEHLEARGLHSGRASTIAAHVTRPGRDLGVSADDLRAAWRARARAVGLGPTRLEAVLDRLSRGGPRPELLQPGGDRLVLEHLGARCLSAPRRQVLRSWCAMLPGGAPAPAVEAAADGLLARLPLIPGHEERTELPGVGERRHDVASRVLDTTLAPDAAPGLDARFDRDARLTPGLPTSLRDGTDELVRALARRGMARTALTRGLDHQRDDDRGPGLGLA